MSKTDSARVRKLKEPRQSAAQAYRGLCDCGDHAWATMTQGYVVLVSAEDAHLLATQKWRPVQPARAVYAIGSGGSGETAYLHRVIMKPSRKDVVDHVLGNGLDNRRPMLEIKSHLKNSRAFRRVSVRNKSGETGVYYRHDAPNRPWIAVGCVDGRAKYIGAFSTRSEAAEAFRKLKDSLYGQV